MSHTDVLKAGSHVIYHMSHISSDIWACFISLHPTLASDRWIEKLPVTYALERPYNIRWKDMAEFQVTFVVRKPDGKGPKL